MSRKTIGEMLKRAKAYCKAHKEKLTKPRLEVLRILALQQKPLGAYEILSELGKIIPNPKPPTVYRAIDFWLHCGFIHRIESLNAFIPCQADHRHRGSQFMICDGCGTVTEAHVCKLPEVFQKEVRSTEFQFSSWSVELHGLCRNCYA